MTLTDLERRVLAHITAQHAALADDLRRHVELPTGGRNVAALDTSRRLLTDRAAALGATVQHVPGTERPDWLFGEKPGQTPLPTAVCRRAGVGRELLIAGHLDTVHDPAGPFQRLTIEPGGARAVGPGCVDMKGGLVIGIAALEAIDACVPPAERPAWTLLLNSDEETGSYHSAGAIRAEAARVAQAGGVGVALEPATADGGLVVERAGSAQFIITCAGKAAHVGRDFTAGVSAVAALARVLVEIERRAADLHRILGVIVNVGPLQGGTATNVVPDDARAWGNVRFVDPAHVPAVRAMLEAACAKGAGAAGARARMDMNVGRPAKPRTPGTMHLADSAKACATELGQAMAFTATGGVCDGNLMQDAGLPTLDTLGVRGGGLHTPTEWIELRSLVERCQLLALFLLRVSRG